MVTTISTIYGAEIEKNTAVLRGNNGRIEISVFGDGLFSLFYDFDARKPEPAARALDPLLVSAETLRAASESERWDGLSDSGTYYALRRGSLEFLVDKASGTLSVYRDGRLIHGGRIGNNDTVVPSNPLRIQGEKAGEAERGKFNFRIEDDDAFFGLGEKSGHLNKRNRSFKLFNKDSLGYDAEYSDPLYKSVPFFIKMNRRLGSLCGLFFPNAEVDEVDFGVESRFYYHVQTSATPYGYFLMTGDSYRDILASYCGIAGKPALPPLFSFGYLASGMAYTDYDDAMEKTLAFFSRAEREGLPCEGMYFSSGYAKADNGERYTFVWNKKKFPDPKSFLGGLKSRGYRVCCNVKPGILLSHPWYSKLAAEKVFIEGPGGKPFVGYYWGNDASFVDFHGEEGYSWWVRELTENIIGQGASGVWNDNNEFELEDESLPAQGYKKLLPVLMAKASYEALSKAYPGKRPWLISRSGYAGIQRYARTWTGDNVSDFKTLRFNTAMGLNLGLSGIPIYGHDIGGFFGSVPDMELLVRWCQSALFQPRFVMHSWKEDGSSTEPWTYPEATDIIINLIRDRYRFLPYIYNAAIQSSESGLPIERAAALEFPDDEAIRFDSLDRMAGDFILVPSTPDRGESEIALHFPSGVDWYDPSESKLVAEKGDSTISYPLDKPRYFFRCGSVIPTNPDATKVADGYFPKLLFLVVPPTSPTPTSVRYIEDDGESVFAEGSHWEWSMELMPEGSGLFRFSVTTKAKMKEKTRVKRSWGFSLPPGFSFEGARGEDLGKNFEFEFSKPFTVIQYLVRGAYR